MSHIGFRSETAICSAMAGGHVFPHPEQDEQMVIFYVLLQHDHRL